MINIPWIICRNILVEKIKVYILLWWPCKTLMCEYVRACNTSKILVIKTIIQIWRLKLRCFNSYLILSLNNWSNDRCHTACTNEIGVSSTYTFLMISEKRPNRPVSGAGERAPVSWSISANKINVPGHTPTYILVHGYKIFLSCIISNCTLHKYTRKHFIRMCGKLALAKLHYTEIVWAFPYLDLHRSHSQIHVCQHTHNDTNCHICHHSKLWSLSSIGSFPHTEWQTNGWLSRV